MAIFQKKHEPTESEKEEIRIQDFFIFTRERNTNLIILTFFICKVTYNKKCILVIFCFAQKYNNIFICGNIVNPLKALRAGIKLMKCRIVFIEFI